MLYLKFSFFIYGVVTSGGVYDGVGGVGGVYGSGVYGDLVMERTIDLGHCCGGG